MPRPPEPDPDLDPDLAALGLRFDPQADHAATRTPGDALRRVAVFVGRIEPAERRAHERLHELADAHDAGRLGAVDPAGQLESVRDGLRAALGDTDHSRDLAGMLERIALRLREASNRQRRQ